MEDSISARARAGWVARAFDKLRLRAGPVAWVLCALCVAVSVVYKSIKCHTMRRVPWEATVITVWILLGMAAAGVVLAGVVKFLE